MKLHEFTKEFQTEEACRTHFKEIREQLGVHCRGCGSKDHYWLQSKWQWQCKICRFRTTLRSGTVMQHAHLPFKKWYLCMALMSSTKKGVSAKEIQRQLGHKRYRTVWTMMQKIREGMGNQENNDFTKRFILNKGEIDIVNNHLPFESTRGNRKSKTLVHFAKFNIKLNDFTLKKTSILGIMTKNDSVFLSGSRTGRDNLRKSYYTQIKVRMNDEIIDSTQKWVNIIRSNFDRSLIGIHHRVSLVYLRNYMDEFCYRLNRRFLGEMRFDNLVETIARRSLWYK